MNAEELISRYNYDEFVPEKYEQWMRFDESPPLWARTPDFTLWHLDGSETLLSAVLAQNQYTVVEFGSFT
jgi:hypothetical protein